MPRDSAGMEVPNSPEPRRLLVVTTEPPPTSSALGTLWAKLSMGAAGGLVIDFLGPDPSRCSSHGDSGLPEAGRLHDLGSPPLSRVASLRRSTSPGARWLFWSALRAPGAGVERVTGRSLYEAWMERQVASRLPALLADHAYDMVVAKAPPLSIARTVARIAAERRIAFGFAMGEPVDHRNDAGGLDERGPGSLDAQQRLADAAAAFLTTKEAYEAYHQRTLRIDPRRIVYFRDSFVPVGLLAERAPALTVGERSLLHWGQVSPWRPLDTLSAALVRWNASRAVRGVLPLGLAVMGRVVDPAARARVRRELGCLFTQLPHLPYPEARAVARTARLFVVITSPRHRDNIPSKLIDALAYRRPILLLAHPGSAAACTVRSLGVGPVADVRDSASVLGALDELASGVDRYEAAYQDDAVARAFHFESIGARFRQRLFEVMGW